MKWSEKAEEAVKKVPFFVRKKVKQKIEAHVIKKGKNCVELEDVKASKKQFLATMATDIKGYQAEVCFGAYGCPNIANSSESLMKKAEKILADGNILEFLKKNVQGDLKYHHEFRITAADCPNACSRPQIQDVGIIGALLPHVTDRECTMCNACVEACQENAVTLDLTSEMPVINFDECLMCGKCSEICPTGTISEEKRGFRVQLGGRLGRHPRLAMEIPGLLSEDEVLSVLKRSIEFYKTNSTNGKRFSHIFEKKDIKEIRELPKK